MKSRWWQQIIVNSNYHLEQLGGSNYFTIDWTLLVVKGEFLENIFNVQIKSNVQIK